jgi:hypothetical protein
MEQEIKADFSVQRDTSPRHMRQKSHGTHCFGNDLTIESSPHLNVEQEADLEL